MRAKRYREWCRRNYLRRKSQGLKSHRYIKKYENSTSAWLKKYNKITLAEWQEKYLNQIESKSD